MFCKNCGKQLSDEAFMCPDCGMPTGVAKANVPTVNENENEKKEVQKANVKAIAIIGFVFACIALFGSLIFGSISLSNGYSMPEFLTAIPALTAIGMGIYSLCMRARGAAKVFSIIEIALSGFAVFYCFICLIAWYSY